MIFWRKMMKRVLLSALFMAVFLISSCPSNIGETSGNEKTESSSAKKTALPEVNIVDIATIKEKYLGKEGVVFIDNRPELKHEKEGRIEDSVNLPYFKKGHNTNVMTKELLLQHAKKSDIIIFYCSGMVRAYHASLAAIEWGYDPDKIFWYKNGWNEWKKGE
jgi:3-mercaptopyruvate sulfurtransferase SseA